MKTYKDMIKFQTFEERYNYLKLSGKVGKSTFGFDRYLNQLLYKTQRWKKVRDQIIIRDCGCDLGVPGYDIYDRILVHHMNPISVQDIEIENPDIYNPKYLICVSFDTHNAIHFGKEKIVTVVERTKNDTCPWR